MANLNDNVMVKKFVYVISILMSLPFLLSSCEKSSCECPSDGGSEERNFYYVQYVISGSYRLIIDEVKYKSEHGYVTEGLSGARSFECVCGPVNRGFKAEMMITDYRGGASDNAVKIYVSKNNGPFAIKASGQYSVEYTIAF